MIELDLVDLPLKIVSHRRSGSHLFGYAFEEKTGIHLMPIVHYRIHRERVFSCIRDPLSTVASFVAMKLETEKQGSIANIGHENYERHSRLLTQSFISDVVDDSLSEYEIFYSYLGRSKNAIVDYENCKLDIESSVIKAASFFDIDLLPNPIPVNRKKEEPLRGYLVSSRKNYLASSGGSDFYEQVYEIVSKKNLTQATALYEKCLEKSILNQ